MALEGSRIGALAVTGVMIAAGALLTLSPAVASAATARASARVQVTARSAAEAASGCLTETFSEADENTYEPCVLDEQVLLNDAHAENPGFAEGPIATDGYYGPETTSDVYYFQGSFGIEYDGITGPQTRRQLCSVAYSGGYRGTYWHDAGCSTSRDCSQRTGADVSSRSHRSNHARVRLSRSSW